MSKINPRKDQVGDQENRNQSRNRGGLRAQLQSSSVPPPLLRSYRNIGMSDVIFHDPLMTIDPDRSTMLYTLCASPKSAVKFTCHSSTGCWVLLWGFQLSTCSRCFTASRSLSVACSRRSSCCCKDSWEVLKWIEMESRWIKPKD